VDVPTLVETEQDLLNNFGEPYSIDKHYEHWLSASSYLSYGGSLRVVRADDADMKNAYVGAGSSIKIKSLENYNQLGYDENVITGRTFISQNPGSWANGITIGIIDAKADQILRMSTTGVSSFVAALNNVPGVLVGGASTIGIDTSSITVGQEILCDISGVLSPGTTVSSIGVGIVTISSASLQLVNVSSTFDIGTTSVVAAAPAVGYGVTQSLYGKVDPGVGTTSILTGYLKGIITEVNSGNVGVKVLSYVTPSGTETDVDYQPSGIYLFDDSVISLHDESNVSYGTTAVTDADDWFDEQNLGITTSSTILWNSIVERPSTTSFAAARDSRFDEIHIIIVDTEGKITGNAGTILEKWTSLSKAKDAVFSVGSPSYWRKFLASNSRYVFGGSQPAGIVTTGFNNNEFESSTDIAWDQNTEGIIFGAIGSQSLVLGKGLDYNGQSGITTVGSLTATLAEISDGYDLFENTDNFQIDFLLMGSASYEKENAQALANKLISVAEIRKDAVAFISPYRGAFISDANVGSVTVNSDAEITNEVIGFYSPIASSSYAVFDSGYKYMYDRFSDTFRYVPVTQSWMPANPSISTWIYGTAYSFGQVVLQPYGTLDSDGKELTENGSYFVMKNQGYSSNNTTISYNPPQLDTSNWTKLSSIKEAYQGLVRVAYVNNNTSSLTTLTSLTSSYTSVPYGYTRKHYKFYRENSIGARRRTYLGTLNTQDTSFDRGLPYEVFDININEIQVAGPTPCESCD
jgi:hypothetical protein